MVPLTRDCDVENMADFGRYYQASWVAWHPTDSASLQPCWVGPLMDGQNIQLRPLVKQGDGQFLLESGFGVNLESLKNRIDFGAPDIGMVPDGPTILFCSYMTPRVAKKGYRSRDTKTVDFNGWEIRKKYAIGSRSPERHDWVWFSFNPEYQTLEQAEDRLGKGEVVGVPLSRTLGVYTLPKAKYSLLAYKRWTIGHVVSPDLIQIKREYGDYEEDIARQTGAEVIVG